MLSLAVIGAFLVTWGLAQGAQEIAVSGQAAVKEAIQQAAPAVVRIDATKKVATWWEELLRDPFFRRFFGEPPPGREVTSVGSGFIVDCQGGKYVLTNNHVVEGAESVRVTYQDGRILQASVIGSDAWLDLAVLSLRDASELPAAPLGSSAALEVGDWVVAIGNPLGFDYTVTLGIVSALNRDVARPDGTGYYRGMIQTDAAINPGNSGGPLVNAQGEVVGMNALIARQTGAGIAVEGINFAVPIDEIKLALSQLVTEGRVTRAWLGVVIQDVLPGMEKQFGVAPGEGVVVADVVPDSPAERAGIQSGDVVVSVDGRPVHNTNELQTEIMYRGVGERVQVGIVRDGWELTLSVVLGERPLEEVVAPAPSPSEEAPQKFGLTVQDVTPELAQRYGLPRTEGVVVVAVESGSRAYWAGIREGDVILEVDRQPIHTLADWNQIVAEIPEDETVLLTVLRAGGRMFIPLP
jgi:serine protease Do